MRKIYIVGTLHNMLPKHEEELKSLLEDIYPDQLLVEIVNKDLKTKNIRKYPKEMSFAYRWAIKHKKKTHGFDTPLDVVKKSVTKKELKKAEEEILSIIDERGLTWKDFNKSEYEHIKEIDILENKIIDRPKDKLRQRQMLKNIQKMLIDDGAILILTGAGHLSFFEKNIKEAIFPLRT